ncbi:hypothetical protein [Helicobacter mesocricetorum]|uniref:hypothetical protein n=1 Tax=Helicobacter mesocricetorum TaxID=87012 RepID=UPI000CF17D80|nr:hypothetical protein [Helicobacter mesocricetorum]
MMIENILRAFLLGVFLSFILMCVFWAGIFSNYINYYGISVFFNPFFGNVFNGYLFIVMVVVFGVGFFIPVVGFLIKLGYCVLLGISLLLFIPSLGKSMGEALLSKKIALTIDGERKNVVALYEDKFYIVYQNSSEVLPTLEERKRNLSYYEKP